MVNTFRWAVWRRRAAAAVVVLAPWTLGAQSAPLPPARDVISRHVAAIGGGAAFKAISSMRVRGRFEMTGQNISAEFEALAARPDKMLMRADIPAIGHTEQGYNGTVAWTVDPQSGPRLLKDRERDEAIADADFDAALHLPNRVKSMTTTGQVTFDSRPAYKVNVVLQSGVDQDEYFDVETGFEIGWEARRATPLGVVPTTAVLRDYKKFGLIMQPTTLVQKALFLEQILRVTSVEYDVVPANAFDPPPSIKAMRQ
jgi:hypothetical protein